MLYIHLFGHLRIFEDERPLQFTALPKALPLLAYLLLSRAEPAPRDALAFLLWSDTPEDRARANLRRHLYDLRQVLPAAPEDTPWVLSQAGTVRWNPAADYWLDVAEFERLSASPDHLAKAVELYADDLLPEVYEDWITLDRERLRNMYLANLSQLIVQSRGQGDDAQAIAYAQRILSHDPLREDAVRELIALRYRVGDRAGALHAYQRFEQLLEHELGVSPMPETRALCAAVVQSVPLPEVGPPSVVGQTSAIPCPHNVPTQLNEFVGRDRDLIAVCERLVAADSRVHLLTLTGPAGTGKTRLALEAATRLLPSQPSTFPDGIFFVDLSPTDEPELVVSAVAGMVGVKESAGQSLLEGLKSFLRSRYVLLLLDNFEQVLDAGPLVTELLAAAPNLRVLVTSRAALRVYGEHEYPVLPLPLPDLEHLPGPESLLGSAAVALFVARARERKPSFSLTEENAGDVAEICVRLDGLPLAIELAASRIKAFTPAGVLERVTSQLAFLTGGTRDRPMRHQTLRGAIDWSYSLLDEEEKALFASLGVFSGGCTLAAAEAVCRPFCKGDVSAGLDSLVDKSLIQPFEQNERSRFRMLAAVREYALEQLARVSLLETIRQSHADYYADLVARAHMDWHSPQQAAWIARLGAEEDNLRAALSWALDPTAGAARIQVGAALARKLDHFWEIRGRLSEARAWYALVLERRSQLSLDMQVDLFVVVGWFAQLQGEYPVADALYQEGLDLARQVQDPHLISRCLHSLGAAAGRQGEYRSAEALLSEAIDLEREASGGAMTADLAALYNNLAIVSKYLGDYERAAALLHESLDFKRTQGHHWGVAISLANLGNLALVREDHAGAEAFFRESLMLRKALADEKGMLILLSGLAELALIRGEIVRSVCLYSAAQRLHREADFPMTAAVRDKHEHNLAALCEQLSDADFAAAWTEGGSMTLDQAVAYALNADRSS